MLSKKRRLDNLTYENYDNYENKRLCNKNKRLGDENKDLFYDNKKLLDEKDRLKNESHGLFYNNKKILGENDELSNENKELVYQMDCFHNKYMRLYNEIEWQKEQLKKASMEENSLKNKLQDQIRKLMNSTKTLQDYIEQNKSLKNTIAEKEDIIDHLQEAMEDYCSMETEHLNLKQDFLKISNELTNQITSLEAAVTEKDVVFEQNEHLKSLITEKENIIENLKTTLDEHFSAAEIQNEQNTIFRKEYEDSQAELALSSLETRNLRQGFQDGGAWLREKQEEILTLEAALKRKEDDTLSLDQALQISQKKLAEVERQTEEKNSCKLCMEENISVVFLPCGHLCCCSGCASSNRVQTCPICRLEIENKFRVFHS